MDSFNNKEKNNMMKNEIKRLIESGNINNAKELIIEYEILNKDDIELYSIKGIVAMLEGEYQNAELFFKDGISKKNSDYDLNYNLAYIYEIQQKFVQAYRQYKMLLKILNHIEIKKKINILKKENEVKEYLNRKRILIIAYFFPPLGGSGVQRTLKFVKYLRNFGWEPIVVTVGKSGSGLIDETLFLDVPKDIEIIRIDVKNEIDINFINRIIEIQHGVVQDNFLMNQYIHILNNNLDKLDNIIQIPDQSIFFAKEAIDNLNELVDMNEIDIIYSTSGPYSDHIIGYYLKQRFRKPWIVDFRDEWTNNAYVEYDENGFLYKILRKMECEIINASDKVLTTTPIATTNYINNFNIEKSKVNTLTNGYDEDDFKNLQSKEYYNSKFQIMHNGIFYMIRTPETFLKALKNIINANPSIKDDFVVNFTQTSNDAYWKKYVAKLGLEDNINFLGYLSHNESLKYANQADLLLLVVGPGEKNKSVYPGKIFEYLRLGKKILSLSPNGSIVDRLIEHTERGMNIDFDNVWQIENYLLDCYLSWKNKLVTNFKITDQIRKFERKILTEEFSDICNQLYVSHNEKHSLIEHDVSEKDTFLIDKLNENRGME